MPRGIQDLTTEQLDSMEPVHPRRLSIDAIEKIINADGGDSLTILPDGTVRPRTDAEKAASELDRQQYKDNLIERLTEENKLLKSALKTLTQKW